MRDTGTAALEKLRTLVGYGTARFFISHNLHLLDWTSQTGMWDMPALKPVNVCPKRLLAFNEALHFQGDRENVGVHFFIDDYQFERIWTRPEKYIRALDGFCCVLTPDFSMYLDVPAPLRIWNHFRKMLVGQIFQNAGLNVVPSIGFGWNDSFSYAFEGVPQGGTVAFANWKKENFLDRWKKNGLEAMMKKIQPKCLLLYGEEIHMDLGTVEVVRFQPVHIQRMRNGKGKTKKVGPRTKWLMENEEAVMSIARRFGIPRQDWEDFRQETLLRSLTCKDDYQKEKASIQTWAGNFTAFIARNWLKKMNAENKTKGRTG